MPFGTGISVGFTIVSEYAVFSNEVSVIINCSTILITTVFHNDVFQGQLRRPVTIVSIELVSNIEEITINACQYNVSKVFCLNGYILIDFCHPVSNADLFVSIYSRNTNDYISLFRSVNCILQGKVSDISNKPVESGYFQKTSFDCRCVWSVCTVSFTANNVSGQSFVSIVAYCCNTFIVCNSASDECALYSEIDICICNRIAHIISQKSG